MSSLDHNTAVSREKQIRRLQLLLGLSRARAVVLAELHFGGLHHARD
ncbi:hypothetical protein AB9K35_15250 [Leisingera sp. XS_AS12]